MAEGIPSPESVEAQIIAGTLHGDKQYAFDEAHDPDHPADFWFQESVEGLILFVVFYTQACRWSRCLGCNLPARMSRHHVGFRHLMAQVDYLLDHPEVRSRRPALRKVIVSNNGSILDEATFSSTALIYLIAKLNLHLPKLAVLSLETRVEYVDPPELEFIARALREGETPTQLELAIGFEVFDDRIRNEVFRKGLTLQGFEALCQLATRYRLHLKCYLMQKPVPEMSDEEGVRDIADAVAYLHHRSQQYGCHISVHLNPTYVAFGTLLERRFRLGEYSPPRLRDVARAALHAEGTSLSVFLGLSDEGLACEGGSFVRPGDEAIIARLEVFNRTQDYGLLRAVVAMPKA
jgi:radical SAM enzyme (TIGR01210 family)